jgi:hypothetical protein
MCDYFGAASRFGSRAMRSRMAKRQAGGHGAARSKIWGGTVRNLQIDHPCWARAAPHFYQKIFRTRRLNAV